jgi:hypothetical protein
MEIAKQSTRSKRHWYRYVLAGLLLGAVLLSVTLVLLAQSTQPNDLVASPPTILSNSPETTNTASTIGTRQEVVTRIHQIFRVRDKAIQTRNPVLLNEIYTVDCPCLRGDQELIRGLKVDGLVWRGIKVSLDVQEVERVNDRLWTVSALVNTSSFDVMEESGALVREISPGQEYSRFALAKPIGHDDWLLGHAAVIEERG